MDLITGQPHGHWVFRRRIVTATLIYLFLFSAYVVVFRHESPIAGSALTMAFTTMGGILSVFIGGAVVDKKWSGN